jgi:hypothetical protein
VDSLSFEKCLGLGCRADLRFPGLELEWGRAEEREIDGLGRLEGEISEVLEG